jgi:MYXO-CTERM domain-containing protein
MIRRTALPLPLLARPLLIALIALAGCGEEMDGADLRGELIAHIADFDDHSETRYALRQDGGEERALRFATPPPFGGGTRLKVWGRAEGDSFLVSRFEEEFDEVATTRSALIGAPKRPVRRWAFVLVNTGGVPTLSKEQAQTKLFSTMRGSIRSYYQEVSYGIQDLDGEVFGPFDYTPTSSCDTDMMARTLRPMIPGTFNQYLWYFNSRVNGCGFAGLASLGMADRPSQNSWYNASSGCVVLVQEPGHNFGMVHSSSMRCTKGGSVVTLALPDDPDGSCSHNEYGNPYDPMGSGCYHMNGYQKAYQDWLSGCNVVKVTASGTFTLLPLEKACNGIQLLQIPFPAARLMSLRTSGTSTSASLTSYFLEFRAPVGIDSPLSARVLVTVGGDIREARRSGGRNWLIDMTPETGSAGDVALPVGRTYADPDPNGPRFTVVSIDASKAVIRVELSPTATTDQGAGICDDGSLLAAPGPDTCEAVPTPPGSAPPPDDPAPDGGTRDSGTSFKPPTKPTGCGCRLDPGTGSGGFFAVGLVALLLLRRRRR